MIVVRKEQHKEIAKEVLASKHFNNKYTFLDMMGVGHYVDRERFQLAIEILDLDYFYKRVEKMFEGMGIEKNIDTSILYEAINHVFKDKPFTDSQLTRYYELGLEFEKITDAMTSLIEEEDHYVDYNVDFILLGGVTMDDIFSAESRNDNRVGDVHEKYGEALWKMKKGEITIKELIKTSKPIVEVLKQLEEEKEPA